MTLIFQLWKFIVHMVLSVVCNSMTCLLFFYSAATHTLCFDTGRSSPAFALRLITSELDRKSRVTHAEPFCHLASINEVNLRWARLVLRWATVSGFNSRCRTSISVCNQLASSHPRPTQPSIPPGSVNEYQLRLGRQRQVWFIQLADERGVCR